MKLARLDHTGKLVEFFHPTDPVPIAQRLHADLVAGLIEVDDNVQLYVKSWINGELVDTPPEE